MRQELVIAMSALRPPELSALCVAHAVGIANRKDMPGHMYFQNAPEFKHQIPDEQEEARQKLENFNSVLRIAFQKDDPRRFEEFFIRLLTLAQATFAPSGFNPAALNDLPTFKREVVQVAGASIKANYTSKLLKCVAIATIATLLLSGAAQAGYDFWLNAQKKAPTDVLPPSADAIKTTAFSLFNTGLVLAASFWGLLFASMTRSIEPTFETLLTPDADLMQPWFRLTFYGIPVVIISLLFQTEVVTISFGGRVSTAQIANSPIIAVMLGLLLGVAERALPGEVTQWSRKFLPSSQLHAQ